MDNKLFKALSSKTRIEIIRRLLAKKYHLSELSREMEISKPVISRHIKILEDANLVEREKIGNVHLLKLNPEVLEKSLEAMVEEIEIEIEKGRSIYDVLKQLPDIGIIDYRGNQFITSVDGEEGLYIYEVNGDVPEKAINEYVIEESILIQLKKLVPVTKKRIKVRIREK